MEKDRVFTIVVIAAGIITVVLVTWAIFSI